MKPDNAATAGSKLISVPKLKGVKLRNASISKEKGSALAKIAKPINKIDKAVLSLVQSSLKKR